jgi:hypothetical protein
MITISGNPYRRQRGIALSYLFGIPRRHGVACLAFHTNSRRFVWLSTPHGIKDAMDEQTCRVVRLKSAVRQSNSLAFRRHLREGAFTEKASGDL